MGRVSTTVYNRWQGFGGSIGAVKNAKTAEFPGVLRVFLFPKAVALSS
jgi:hypothetical protein